MGNCPTSLRTAVRFSDVEEARKILDKAGDGAADLINNDYSQDCILQSCCKSTGNVLYYAATCRRVAIAEIMLEKGADIYTTGESGETCFHVAARMNSIRLAKALIQQGFDHRTTDDKGRHPIHYTGLSRYVTKDMIRYLLEDVGSREDVNLRDYSQQTPLHNAVYYRNLEVVEAMISYGADVNDQSNTGDTPLHLAIRYPAIYKLLVDNGADETIKNKAGRVPKLIQTTE